MSKAAKEIKTPIRIEIARFTGTESGVMLRLSDEASGVLIAQVRMNAEQFGRAVSGESTKIGADATTLFHTERHGKLALHRNFTFAIHDVAKAMDKQPRHRQSTKEWAGLVSQHPDVVKIEDDGWILDIIGRTRSQGWSPTMDGVTLHGVKFVDHDWLAEPNPNRFPTPEPQ